MDTLTDEKRLFLGFETVAPWPDTLPSGRLIAETQRHLTLVFLGNLPSSIIDKLLQGIPLPPFQIGPIGYFDKCLFLPERSPRVVAWHGIWQEAEKEILSYQKDLSNFVQAQGVSLKLHETFLSHVTLCRSPFHVSEWKHAFVPLPFYIKNLHLYESLGSLNYQPIWTHTLLSPFEEFEHTADIAFIVRGETPSQIYLHAQAALSFHFPDLQSYLIEQRSLNTLNEIVMALNDLVARVDADIGCPFKAISFHGELISKGGYLEWEMIVDV